ncbi:uncharacterized protein F4822DRAFT_397264 [Hypoxylon trugodes]|uniref:uncharacterized protein n=1 Tax=Hypoxylon trugodes TaxID=326681 RepID=UPI00219D00E5|nr:uncharacterized protein F4822DRAFT_397264 [Hypoxylon trugodes]KAI1391615.1 hypothetical protein F4822DRAFT_397264 [Hypoxylon trugodes]
MSTSAAGTAITPFPYAAGNVMEMTNSQSENISATITSVFPLTISPVMEVRIRTKKGFQKAILKVYDRRFGACRDWYAQNRKNRYNPHNQWVENAWQRYIRTGMAERLSEHLHREDKKDIPCYRDDSDFDNESPQWEKVGKIEGILHHKAQKYYAQEIQAYGQLKKHQGRFVPRLIDSVTLCPSAAQAYLPPDLPPSYFQVRGILLQRINGFNLDNLPQNVPNLPMVQEQIIQTAIDMAREINQAGVMNLDCVPRNVLVARVDDYTFQTFMIDFTDSAFKYDYKDTDDPDDKDSWASMLEFYDNQGAIGSVMTTILRKATGFVPKITYKR